MEHKAQKKDPIVVLCARSSGTPAVLSLSLTNGPRAKGPVGLVARGPPAATVDSGPGPDVCGHDRGHGRVGLRRMIKAHIFGRGFPTDHIGRSRIAGRLFFFLAWLRSGASRCR